MANKKRGKSTLIIFILVAIVAAFILGAGLYNLGGEEKPIAPEDYRTTGTFVIKGYDAGNHTDFIELKLRFSIYDYQYENLTSTNRSSGQTFLLNKTSFFVIDEVLNGSSAFNFYLPSGLILLRDDADSNELWIPLSRRANPTWTANLIGAIDQCADFVADGNLSFTLQIYVPENKVDDTQLNLRLGYSNYYPNGSMSNYNALSFDKQVVLRNGDMFNGTQRTALWIKFEDAVLNLVNADPFTIDGKNASHIEIEDGAIYAKLPNMGMGDSGSEEFNQIGIRANFATVPTQILIWDGFIGEESTATHVIG